MKKSICFLLVLTVCIAVFAACRPVPPELDEMTPLEIWNVYVAGQENPSEPVYAVSCLWDYSSASSLGPPCIQTAEGIEEVLRRLKSLSLSEDQILAQDPEWYDASAFMSFTDGSLSLVCLRGQGSEQKVEQVLRIYLRGDVLVLEHEGEHTAFRLNADQTEFKRSMVEYLKKNGDRAIRLRDSDRVVWFSR